MERRVVNRDLVSVPDLRGLLHRLVQRLQFREVRIRHALDPQPRAE